MALLVRSTVCFLAQAWTLSAGGGPPSPQTEPQLHHRGETEEDPRCAERAFQTSRALTGSKVPPEPTSEGAPLKTDRPRWNKFCYGYPHFLKDGCVLLIKES